MTFFAVLDVNSGVNKLCLSLLWSLLKVVNTTHRKWVKSTVFMVARTRGKSSLFIYKAKVSELAKLYFSLPG